MEKSISGIHHVTAITDDPQQNLNFYAGVLGLRFVKKTVNFDVPDTYHLYYGDDLGHPGTILTFFSWPGYPRGQSGTGQVTTISFSIPLSALDYWKDRLTQHGITVEGPLTRFNEQFLAFTDHEGLALELVAQRNIGARGSGWTEGSVPAEHAIRDIYGVTLSLVQSAATGTLLSAGLGFRYVSESGNRTRYETSSNGKEARVDLLSVPDKKRGVESIGTIHHVAWRTSDDEQQLVWRNKLVDLEMIVTQVMDRTYFHSIYFREPGGVLFEIATDTPGFTVDEPATELGTHLKLPPWLEARRATLEQNLPPLSLATISQEK